MKEKIKQLISYLGRREFLILLTLMLACYALVERMGLFRLEPATLREVFHSRPVEVLSLFVIVSSVAGIISTIRHRRGLLLSGSLMFFLGILIMSAGLWASIYTRFEGDFFRAEGTAFSAFKGDYIQRSLYKGKKAELPQVGINFKKIRPEASPDGRRLERIEADVVYTGRGVNRLIDATISSDKPFVFDRTDISFTDFGYAPRFMLYDLKEKELERQFLYMKLFPAGMEDFTEAKFLGYLFYVRCYPDYVDNDGIPGTKSPHLNNPVFNLRIVRNRDIVYDGLVRPDQKVRFDNFIVALPEVKMWVKMRLVRDSGLPVASAGIPVLMLGVLMMWIGRRNRS